ncbi:hypothetical protein BOH78_5386, partial [Pichia kudriavzevii]
IGLNIAVKQSEINTDPEIGLLLTIYSVESDNETMLTQS